MSVGTVQPFSPIATLTFTQTASAQSGAITSSDSALVFNATAAPVFVSFGGLGTVATAASTPVPPNSRQLFATGAYVTTVSVISASSGANSIYVTSGSGTAY